MDSSLNKLVSNLSLGKLKETENEFEKDFFKLMNNSVFEKTMKNIRNCVDVRLVNNHKKALKLAAKPNFKQCTIFDENLVAIYMR